MKEKPIEKFSFDGNAFSLEREHARKIIIEPKIRQIIRELADSGVYFARQNKN